MVQVLQQNIIKWDVSYGDVQSLNVRLFKFPGFFFVWFTPHHQAAANTVDDGVFGSTQ